MHFLHANEIQSVISEDCSGKPEKVDLWLNADLVMMFISEENGSRYARTQEAWYRVDGYCSDIEELFKAGFKLPEPQKGE